MIPLKDRVIVRTEDQTESRTEAGLHVIDEGAKRVIGTVISVGHVTEIKPNDVVIFSPFAGSRLDHEGESLLVLREEDILAVWE